ncbi:hypothetical protein [Chitinophaga rhizophila]|uniref:DUF3592 domain-containing protein n=1 Tax=Chitinophaga rhizophila TaxID=2866212 RepID=A0ABS7GK83_9BACT|nr:hypothetical protein [Chitinophaga rhizophila]MBW8687515.1 hypothetical protein [Chitinophaga rhizophila]
MKPKVYWGLAFLLIFVTFYILMPADIYLHIRVLTAITGSLLCFICLTQLLPKLRFISIPLSVLMAAWFYVRYSALEDAELKEYGEIVPATVLDVYSHHNAKSGASYKLFLAYYRKNGEIIREEMYVSPEEFAATGKGQQIRLIYSTKHPELKRLILK